MTRALHLFTSPRSELFVAPPMMGGVEAYDILTPLFFQEGEDQLDPSYATTLDDFAAVLGWFAGQGGVEVRRHSDDGLPPAEARALSLRRAQVLVEALELRGVRPGLLRPRALGASQPASSGYLPLQRAVNRRVELCLLAPAQRVAVAA